jgi:hypothetical protein
MLPGGSESLTGRDHLIITEALATAIIALEQLPPKRQPTSNMEDIKIKLSAMAHAATVSHDLAKAKCRFRPDLDYIDVFREYGIIIEHYKP